MRSASTAPPHINSYKIPNHVALIDEIPRKVSGTASSICSAKRAWWASSLGGDERRDSTPHSRPGWQARRRPGRRRSGYEPDQRQKTGSHRRSRACPGRRRSPGEAATTAGPQTPGFRCRLRTPAATPAPPARIPARARRQVSRPLLMSDPLLARRGTAVTDCGRGPLAYAPPRAASSRRQARLWVARIGALSDRPIRRLHRAKRESPPVVRKLRLAIEPESRLADTAVSCSTLGRAVVCDTLADPACHGYSHFEAN